MMEKYRKGKYHSTFKIFKYTVMLFMLIPMLILGAFIITSYSNNLYADLEQRRRIADEQILADTEEQFEEIQTMRGLFVYEKDLNDLLKYTDAENTAEFRQIVLGAKQNMEAITNVGKYSRNVMVFSLLNNYVASFERVAYASTSKIECYERYMASGNTEQLFAEEEYITITKPLMAFSNVHEGGWWEQREGNNIGMISVQYSKLQLKDDLAVGQYGCDIALNMYSADGELVFSTGDVAESYKTEHDVMLANAKIEIVFGNNDEKKISSNVTTYTFTCLFLCLLAAYAVSSLCARFLYRTIRNVFAKMGSVGEPSLKLAGKNVYVDDDGSKNMEEKLAKMLDKMQNLQLTSLQLQINPHFVFNVLNYVNLKMFGDDEAKEKSSKILTLLSEVLDYAMSEPKYSALIFEEIEMTKKYIEIEKVKTDDGFDVIWNVDKNVLEKEGIKLFLQPIVENSIMHGIKSLEDRRGKIEITVKADENGVYFVVEDNGIGMTAEQLDRVRARLDEGYSDSSKHIGLRNVNERIRMVYGEGFGVSIESNKSGTTVTIRIGNARADG